MDVYRQALKIIQNMVEDAKRMALSEPMAMTLATVDEAGQPSARTVYLQAVVDEGLIFFTNRYSRKAIQLAANPRAAVCLYSEPLARQIQVEGSARPLAADEAAAYWALRERDSQLAAWASAQSEPPEARDHLQRRVSQYRQRFDFHREVPIPSHWCGFCLEPQRIEFWKKDWRHPQQRLCYQNTPQGWSVIRLNP